MITSAKSSHNNFGSFYVKWMYELYKVLFLINPVFKYWDFVQFCTSGFPLILTFSSGLTFGNVCVFKRGQVENWNLMWIYTHKKMIILQSESQGKGEIDRCIWIICNRLHCYRTMYTNKWWCYWRQRWQWWWLWTNCSDRRFVQVPVTKIR